MVGNEITLTCQSDEHTTIVDKMIVGFISDESLHCIFKRTVTVDGVSADYPTINLELRKEDKTPVKYPAYIIGTWEGRVTSDQSQYDDGKPHRWEFSGLKTYT